MKRPRVSAREKASCLSVLLFWWLNQIFYVGWKRGLTPEDVHPVLSTDRAGPLGEKLEKNWLKHLLKCSKSKRKPSFSWVLFLTFGPKFLFYGIFSMLEECVFRMIQVVSLGYLITYFKVLDVDRKVNSGTMANVATVGIILGSLSFLLSFHWSIFNTHHVCTHMRLAVSSLIHRKTLRLSQATMRSFSIGQLITMMSTDVHRLDMLDLHLNYLWIAPIQLGIVIYLLYYHYEFGIPSLSGLALLVIFVLFQYIMGIYVGRLRNSKIVATNKRMRIITEIMDAFYNIKLYAWENVFYNKAKESRRVELKYLKTTMMLRILTISFSLIMTKMTVFFTLLFYIYWDKKALDAERVFITVLLYEHVRLNLVTLFTRGAVDFAEIAVTAKRITEFMLLEEKYEDPSIYNNYELEPALLNSPEIPPNGVYMNNVSCKWHYDQDNLTLENISLEVTEGKMLAIVGPTGAGKSSCLAAILGELPITSGKLTVQGKMAYIPQTPWLYPGTIRQNIIFGRQYNEEWYNNVVDICGLKSDFETIDDGDNTKVIEAVLSIGQKARICLARAVYSNCDIYLLDDPLNCVDVRLQRHILENCIRGALKHKTVILVTHQIQYLEAVDDIAIILNGKQIARGTYKELTDEGIQFTKLMPEEGEEYDEMIDESELLQNSKANRRNSCVVIEEELDTHKLIVTERVPESMPEPSIGSAGGLSRALALIEINDEEESTIEPKKMGFKLFWSYVTSSSSWFLILCLIFLTIAVQGIYSLSEWYLELWTEFEEHGKQEDGVDSQTRNEYIIIYCSLIPALIIVTLLRSLVMFKICIKSSLTLFCQLLSNLLHAKARFSEFSGSGHGINRFSKDIVTIDELLPNTIYNLTGVFCEIVGAIIILIVTSSWTVIPSAIFLLCNYLVYNVYHKSATITKRLEANARSPLYAHTTKALEGVVTIRAFEQQWIFQRIFDELQDHHTSTWYMYISMNAWLSLVGDWLSILLVVSVTLIFVFGELYFREVTPSIVGLAIAKVIEISILMQIMMQEVAASETEMISVERVLDAYSAEESEAPWESDDKTKPPGYWPIAGHISFDNVTVFGNTEKPLLQHINLEIFPGEKIGVVGRSGSGKSTLLNTLFRITEPSEGKIILDDIDIQTIGLHDLRRNLSIIPQVTHIFAGTLRMNLDPTNIYPDHEIWNVLNEVALFDTVKTMDAGLDTQLFETTWQFSPGQVQLLGLARALLQKNQILCLDQATNNLDPTSQQLMQKKIREGFKNRTVITIGHRLQALMDCNKIMVIENGQVVDYGDPYTLIKEGGPLHNLVMHSGKKNADEIFKLAKENEARRKASKRTQATLFERTPEVSKTSTVSISSQQTKK